MTGEGYFRHVYQIEVLSRGPLPELDLEDLDYQINHGACSGKVELVVSNEEVTKERMAELLTAQGSDPEFLIWEDEEDK